MSLTISSKVEGLKPTLARLKGLKRAVATRVLRAGVTAGNKIILKAAKQRVRKGKGLLRKSLGQKVKVFRSSAVAVGIVGPRKGFAVIRDGKKHDPVKYAHIEERGRTTVTARKAQVLTDGKVVFGHKVKQYPGHPFMGPASRETGPVSAAVAAEMGRKIDDAAKKGS